MPTLQVGVIPYEEYTLSYKGILLIKLYNNNYSDTTTRKMDKDE